jgi:hypothetical protein
LDGLVGAFYKCSCHSGFFDFFFPKNESIVTSYQVVQAFPSIPRLALGYLIYIPLECSIIVEQKNLQKTLKILLDDYRIWYGQQALPCINLVIRKILSNDKCKYDMTFSPEPLELICIDFGFYGTKEYEYLLKNLIRNGLMNLAYGWHLGKYVNNDILNFARQKFLPFNAKMQSLKKKYDPYHIFSTPYLNFLFS